MNLKEFERKHLGPNFKAVSWHLPGGTEENREKQDNWSPGQDFNPGPPEYKAGVARCI
jgi:hypothetical protein